jgi:hypothetical protein
MDTKKIDDAPDQTTTSHAAVDTADKVEKMAKNGVHLVQKAAGRVGQAVEEIAVKALRSARETAQKAVHAAKDVKKH